MSNNLQTTLTSEDVSNMLAASPNHPNNKKTASSAATSEPADLHSFLRKYHRVTVSEACKKMVVDNVDAWVGFGGQWKKLAVNEVNAIIARAENADQSFCGTFLKEKLGFSHAKYNDMKAQFDEIEFGNPVGIYEADHGNRVALVVGM